MRRYMAFARIFLILSIINFARAAPVIGVSEASSESSLSSPDSTSRLPSPDASFSSPDSTSRLPSPDASLSSPDSSSRLPSPDHTWPNELPAKKARPLSPDPSWLSELPAKKARPPSPDLSWPSELPAKNTRPPSPDFSWPSYMPAAQARPPTVAPPSSGLSWPNRLTLSPIAESPPHQSADGHPISSPEPPSPAVPETKDFLSRLGPGPGSSHSTEPETKSFLDLLLKGKIKRRISGSGAAQESQATIDHRSTQ